MEVKWGLVPDMGITYTLPRLVPLDVAKELTFTGRLLSGEEARGARPRHARRRRPARGGEGAGARDRRPLARRRPRGQAALRRELDRAGDEALLLETQLQQALIGSPNQLAAMTAGAANEQPVFVDPPRVPSRGAAADRPLRREIRNAQETRPTRTAISRHSAP